MKITVDLDADLYRAAKVEAARTDRSIRDVFEEAIAAWLEDREAAEDRASADEALAEYNRNGGVVAEAFYERIVAETRARYGPTSSETAAEDPTS